MNGLHSDGSPLTTGGDDRDILLFLTFFQVHGGFVSGRYLSRDHQMPEEGDRALFITVEGTERKSLWL
jgi:hypothetical protein